MYCWAGFLSFMLFKLQFFPIFFDHRFFISRHFPPFFTIFHFSKEEISSRGSKGPRAGFFRGIAQFLVGKLFGYLAFYGVPEEWLTSSSPAPFLPFGVSFGVVRLAAFPIFVVVGVDLVGSIGGRQTGNAKRALLAAYLPFLFCLDFETLVCQ